jgi:hypothetical protein
MRILQSPTLNQNVILSEAKDLPIGAKTTVLLCDPQREREVPHFVRDNDPIITPLGLLLHGHKRADWDL